jgi:hypothetical protein
MPASNKHVAPIKALRALGLSSVAWLSLGGGALAQALPPASASDPPPGPIKLFQDGGERDKPPGLTGGVAQTSGTASEHAGQSVRDGIAIEPLRPLDPDMAGLLTPADGGMPADLWAGMQRPEVESALSRLPEPLTSPALRDLARRLLVSSVDAPVGDVWQKGLASLRLQALLRLGYVAEAIDLSRIAPSALQDEAVALQLFEWQWLAAGSLRSGDRDAVCARLNEARAQRADLAWGQWQAICQMAAGEGEAALLTLDLLRDRGEKDDLFFRFTEAAVSGQRMPPKGGVAWTGPQLAMLIAARRPLPPDAKFDAPGGFTALALYSEAPYALRSAAAETAALQGGMDATRLLEAYRQPSPAPTTPGAGPAAGQAPPRPSAASLAGRRPSPLMRAEAIRALTEEPSPAIKAGLFKAAFLAASVDMLAGAYGSILLNEVRSFSLTEGFAVVAPLVARLYLLQNDPQAALPWLALAREDALRGKDEGAFARLWPLAEAAGLPADRPMDQGRWLRELGGEAARPLIDDALLTLAALRRPLGRPLDRPLDGSTVDSVAAPKGAVLLEALNLLGAEGPGGATGEDMAAVILSLRDLGLESDARRLAVEHLAHRLRPLREG